MPALARWCVRNRYKVLVVWLVALIGLLALDIGIKANYSNKFTLPDTESQRALEILQKDFPTASGDTEQIVIQAKQGTIRDADVQQPVTAMLQHVAHMPHVTSVTTPYQVPTQVSKDGTIGFARVILDEQSNVVPADAVRNIIKVAEKANSPNIKVALGGAAIQQDQPQKQSNSDTIIGIIAAFVILVLAFGAFWAALLPLGTALCAIGIGYALTGILSNLFSIASFATILGVLIGLGVGVDYALFILTRHRNGLKAGRAIEDSIANAVNTAGRAVFFAGLTVCIALLGQFALGVSFLYGVAVTAAITVGLTMLGALTLLPALSGIAGYHVLSRKARKRLSTEGPSAEAQSGFWLRWARTVEKGPVIRAVGGLIIVVVIALPILTLRQGLADSGSDPKSTSTRQAYDLLAKGFGPGFNGSFQLVATLNSPSDVQAFQKLADNVSQQPGIVHSQPKVVPSPNGKAALAVFYGTTAPQSAQSSSTLHHLRNEVVPRAEQGTSLKVLVGGVTAGQDDFAHILSHKLPQFIAVVVVLAFLLLMLVFRSLMIPLVASIMNLLSVCASLGIMNAVFEWGWGHSIFGIDRTGPVEVFIPPLLFSILFGLSMDYEVFLVSRIHEEWLHSRDNRLAVTRGQAETGRVITAAALIMILVFASFVGGDNVIIKQFGIGLAGAIIIDAFIIRTLVVPSVMHIVGKSNWWLPGWLDRALPTVNVEGTDDAAPPPPKVPEPAAR